MTMLSFEEHSAVGFRRGAPRFGATHVLEARRTGSFRGTTASAGRVGEMQLAFRGTGGVVAGDELSQLLRRTSDQPISLLARWIVQRRIVHFEWQGLTWLPLFQFDLASMEVRPGLHQAVAELRGVFDDWELTQWFARPNCWLDGRSPSELMAADPDSVVEVARADRFVAAG